MKSTERLTPNKTSVVINLNNFRAAMLYVQNPTGSAVLVRAGGTDVPSLASADYRVPANGFLLVAVDGTNFAATFADQLAVTAPATSNLQTVATIELLDADEKPPAFGSANFQSLSLSDLLPLTAFSGVTTSTVFDLGAWGGAVVFVAPGSGSGQGVITVDVSASPTGSFTTLGTWSFWPSIPATIMIPRTSARYMRVTLNATAIPGEPAISGSYGVRATLTELFDKGYLPSGASITKSYSLAPLGSVSYTLVTAGLPAVSIGLNNATGSNGELILEASSSATGPWRLVSFREQSLAGFYNSIYRTVGNLDLFLRVSVLELSNVPMTGTVAFSIPEAPDENGILQSVYAALGDVGQPVNVGQSIYHLLARIDATATNINAGISTSNVILAAINTGLATTNSLLTTANSLANTANTSLSSIDTDTTSLATALVRGESPTCFSAAIAAAGAWTNMGAFLVPGWYITHALATHVPFGPSAIGSTLFLATGGAAFPVNVIYAQFAGESPAGSSMYTGQVYDYFSPRSAGFLIPVGHTNLWGLASAAAGTMHVMFNQVNP